MSAGVVLLAVAAPVRGAARANAPLRLARLVLGDFRERSRSYAFLVTLVAAVWAAHVFLPPNGSNYATLQIGGHRGVYGSAWVGALVAMLANAFLGFAGFYLVKSAIERDRRTQVGEVLAGTPLSKPLYTLSKALSNFLVLASMMLVLGVSAGALQLMRGEDTILRPAALFTPLVWVTLPYMAVVASLAVCFEAVPWLRGGFGNVVWFFLWTATLGQSSFGAESTTRHGNDLMGMQLLIPDMVHACIAAFPGQKIGPNDMSMGFSFDSHRTPMVVTFPWGGITWTPAMIGARLLWVVAAVGLALAAAIPFDRFERGAATPGNRARAWARRVAGRDATSAPVATSGDPDALLATLHTLRVGPGSAFGAMVIAELRVALKGLPRVWWLVTLALVPLGLFVPLPAARIGVASVAWVWPVLVWSAFGTREARFGTAPLFASSPRPLDRQLPAQWLAGVFVAVLLTAALGLRLFAAGEWAAGAAWLGGVLFVPAFALASGTLTGNPRLFEAVYLCMWYGGVLNRVPAIDPSGGSVPAKGWGTAIGFAAATVVMLIVARIARAWRWFA